MKIVNLIPHLQSFVRKYPGPKAPTADQISLEYLQDVLVWLEPMLEDFAGYRRFDFAESVLSEVTNWNRFAKHAMALDSLQLEADVSHWISEVEKSMNAPLKGEVVIYGAMTLMDGYARFNRGRHRVFLGLDDFFPSTDARNILITHELTHVLREGRPETWSNHGLQIDMDHDAFTQNQPVIEHLFSEGLSCYHSEILVPRQDPWNYVYQNPESYQVILKNSKILNQSIHKQILEGHYRNLYAAETYGGSIPRYAHYLWAWKWLQSLHQTVEKDFSKLWKLGSKDLIQHALNFQI